MFLGVSKNVGGGFRIGVGTMLGSPQARKQDKDFQRFMEKVETELESVLSALMNVNGIDLKRVRKEKLDVNELLQTTNDYQSIQSSIQLLLDTVEEVNFSGDTGVVGRRKITRALFSLKESFKNAYPDFSPEAPPSSTSKAFSGLSIKDLSIKIFIWSGILILPIIFSWFTLTKRFDAASRIVAFGWMLFFLYLLENSPK